MSMCFTARRLCVFMWMCLLYLYVSLFSFCLINYFRFVRDASKFCVPIIILLIYHFLFYSEFMGLPGWLWLPPFQNLQSQQFARDWRSSLRNWVLLFNFRCESKLLWSITLVYHNWRVCAIFKLKRQTFLFPLKIQIEQSLQNFLYFFLAETSFCLQFNKHSLIVAHVFLRLHFLLGIFSFFNLCYAFICMNTTSISHFSFLFEGIYLSKRNFNSNILLEIRSFLLWMLIKNGEAFSFYEISLNKEKLYSIKWNVTKPKSLHWLFIHFQSIQVESFQAFSILFLSMWKCTQIKYCYFFY